MHVADEALGFVEAAGHTQEIGLRGREGVAAVDCRRVGVHAQVAAGPVEKRRAVTRVEGAGSGEDPLAGVRFQGLISR